MSFLKRKITPFLKRIKNFRVFNLKKNKTKDQINIDQKLVYSLSTRKIPNSKQLKHLNRFLNKKETNFIKILFLIVIASTIFLIYSFVNNKFVFIPKEGGSYVEGVVGYPKNVNPLYSNGNSIDQDLTFLVYSSLLKYNNNGELVGDLVESFNIDNTGKIYTFKIKENVSWHDGSKLTTDDIIFTFNLMKNPEYRSSFRQAFKDVDIEKIDDYNFSFSIPEPYGPFLSLLTFKIMPKNLWSGYNPDSIILSDLNLMPIGSGPYKFKSLYKNKNGEIKEYELELNENYYGKKPYIKNLKFEFYIDKQEAINALNNKQISGTSYIPFSSRSDLLAQNSLNIYDLIQAQTTSIFFNSEKNSFLADKENRLWLEKAINKEEIVSEVFYNAYRVSESLYLQESPYYINEPESHNFEPDEAKKYFLNTKKELEEEKDFVVELVVVGTDKNIEVAQKIKKYWENVGVKVNVKTVNGEQAANIISERNFEAIIYGQEIGGDPDVFSFWHSSQSSNNGLNISNYNNAQVDRLLIEARTEINNEERIKKYQEIQETLNIEVPAIFLYSPTFTYIQSRDIKGFSGNIIISPENRFNSISDWYLKTKLKFSR